jgi:hypothetical protein
MSRSCSLVRFSVPSNRGTGQATNDSAFRRKWGALHAAQIATIDLVVTFHSLPLSLQYGKTSQIVSVSFNCPMMVSSFGSLYFPKPW